MILLFWSWQSTDDVNRKNRQLKINNRKIQTEKIYLELEGQIEKLHGQIISTEKLIDEDAIITEQSTYSASYRINLKFLNKRIILNLIKEFALTHSLEYQVSSIDLPLGVGIKVELVGTKSQKIVLFFYEMGAQRKRVNKPIQTTLNYKKSDKGPDKRLVLIIDDIGYDYPVFKKFLRLQYNITYAILPLLPFSKKMSQEAYEQGREVLLHLPMEPQNMQVFNPGPGVLLINDSPDEIAIKMQQNFASIRHAVGTNNHMGSAFSQYKNGLDTVMSILGQKKLFFIDSKTAPGNTAKLSALNYGVPYLSRDIFLDNEQNIEYINRQLDKAINIAMKSGKAIAIGHPYPKTVEVFESRLGEIAQLGITIVPASSLLN